MKEDERVWAVRQLLSDYVKSPSLKHIRDPYAVGRLAPEIVRRLDRDSSDLRQPRQKEGGVVRHSKFDRGLRRTNRKRAFDCCYQPRAHTSVDWLAHAAGRAARCRAGVAIDSGSSCGQWRRGCGPAGRSSPARHTNERQHRASQRALPFFCQKLLERGIIQHRHRQQLLELAVLVFEDPQPLGFGHIQAAVLGLPVV